MKTQELITVTLTLFSVIDAVGALPMVIQIKRSEGRLPQLQTTLVAGGLMLLFLFGGESVLHLLGLDITSFALAGAVLMFLTGLEMILGISLVKEDVCGGVRSLVPLAFPMLAGAGTLTTIVSLRSVYASDTLLVGIVINVIIIYGVLKAAGWLEGRLGCGGFNILRKVFGIVVLAIAFQVAKTNLITDSIAFTNRHHQLQKTVNEKGNPVTQRPTTPATFVSSVNQTHQ